MKSDARFLINQRRLKKSPNLSRKVSHGIIDARKILNSRLGKKSRLQADANPVVHRPFSNLRRTVPSKPSASFAKVPEKHVKLAKDGNIWITAKPKATVASNSRSLPAATSASTSHTKIQTVPRWTPTDVDSVDVEHIGIDDVLDMDSLPSAVVGSSHKLQGRMPHRSLADEIVDMQNTMVADQVTSPQQATSVCVSNLHASVTKQDIMELFGDVGLIKRAEMVQPGIATIEFFYPTDAVRACDLYHNRLLDGQPMQCYIQPPTVQRSFISQRLGERVQTPSLPHFPSTSSRTMHNPRNVRFTVKLT